MDGTTKPIRGVLHHRTARRRLDHTTTSTGMDVPDRSTGDSIQQQQLRNAGPDSRGHPRSERGTAPRTEHRQIRRHSPGEHTNQQAREGTTGGPPASFQATARLRRAPRAGQRRGRGQHQENHSHHRKKTLPDLRAPKPNSEAIEHAEGTSRSEEPTDNDEADQDDDTCDRDTAWF